MNQTIEGMAEIAVFIRKSEYDYSIIVEPEGIRFERYLKPGNARETLQMVENSIKANGRKREREREFGEQSPHPVTAVMPCFT